MATSPDSSFPFRRSSSEPTISSATTTTTSRRRSKSKPHKPSSSTLSSALTEERLREFNRRAARSSSNSATSPYYRGLTDSGLYIRSLALSPGRNSISSGGSGRSVSSTLFLKMHEWGISCFSKLSSSSGGGAPLATPPPRTPPPQPRKGSWDPGLSPRGTRERGSGRRSDPVVMVRRGKPLRESDSDPAEPEPEPEKVTAPKAEASDRAIGGGRERSRGSTAVMKAVESKEREFVWAHKYRPRALKEFICNRDSAEELRQMVTRGECSHYIFEGPPGVGKRTMVLALLRDAFGPEKLKTKNELKKIELKGEHVTSIDINVKISSQHVEVHLSELRGYEKHVIVALISEAHATMDKAIECDLNHCRVVILNEADKLSTDAQHYIHWLMEKYKGCSKIFFCCSDASKLQPIKNLCKIVKLQPPSDSEIVEVLEYIAKHEGIELPHFLAKRIAEKSKHNLRQAIRSFEASWRSSYPFKENQEILTGWEEEIANIAKNIIEEQSPKQLYIIRGKLKKLIEHDVSPDFIFSTLIAELKKNLDEQFQTKVDALYQEYKIDDGHILDATEKSLAFPRDKHGDSGNKVHDQRKNIHHFMIIEEFTAKFMSFYKSFITKNTGEPDCCPN